MFCYLWENKISPERALSWSCVRLGSFLGVEGVPCTSLTGGELIGTTEFIVCSSFFTIPFRAELESERFSEKTSFWASFKLAGMLLAL